MAKRTMPALSRTPKTARGIGPRNHAACGPTSGMAYTPNDPIVAIHRRVCIRGDTRVYGCLPAHSTGMTRAE